VALSYGGYVLPILNTSPTQWNTVVQHLLVLPFITYLSIYLPILSLSLLSSPFTKTLSYFRFGTHPALKAISNSTYLPILETNFVANFCSIIT
jgi:hypothetical protein